jgi:hypothetical protein
VEYSNGLVESTAVEVVESDCSDALFEAQVAQASDGFEGLWEQVYEGPKAVFLLNRADAEKSDWDTDESSSGRNTRYAVLSEGGDGRCREESGSGTGGQREA